MKGQRAKDGRINNPSSVWWWKDYDGELGLRRCSYAAQGFWMRLLSIMAASEKRGYLIDGKAALTPLDLAMMLPGGLTVETVESYLSELRAASVFSVTAGGVIYNRRMVSDEKQSATNARNGKKGGDASASKGKVFGGRSAKDGSGARSGPRSGGRSPTISTKTTIPTDAAETDEVEVDPKEARRRLAARIAEALGVTGLGDLNPRLSVDLLDVMAGLVAEGCSLDADIVPALAYRPGGLMPDRPGYWASVARSNRQKREAAGVPLTAVPPTLSPPRRVNPLDARNWLKAWRRDGTWTADQGPRPGEPGCWVSAEMIAAFKGEAAA